MYGKIFIFIIVPFLFFSCKSPELHHNGTGNTDYRELQSEIRDGEAGLVETSKDIESTGQRIEERINDIESTGQRIEERINDIESTGGILEQSIEESAGNQQEIGDILQQIRRRKLPENQ